MQHPFQITEVIYYAVVFLVGFLSGVSQTLRERNYISCRHVVNIGLCAGFLAFAVVTFVDGHLNDRAGDEFFYLGIASLIGLSVKYQDQIIRSAWRGFASKFGIDQDRLDNLSQDHCDFDPPSHHNRKEKRDDLEGPSSPS